MRYLMMLLLLPAGAFMAAPIISSMPLASLKSPSGNPSGGLSTRLCDREAEDACGDAALSDEVQFSRRSRSAYLAAALMPVAAIGVPKPGSVSPFALDLVSDSGPAGVPLSFNDPAYVNTTSSTTRIKLRPGSSRTDVSIIENSGDPTITCEGSCDLTRVRIQSREGVRCVSGNINLAWVYIQATGVGDDHADGVQCYSPGSTGTVTVKNSTFRMAGSTTAGYFSADNWQGSHVFENVLFEGGNHGLRIPADGGSSVSLKNVYFVRGSFRYGAFLFDVVNGRRIKILQWENVRWASWRGDQLVLEGSIPQP